MHSGKVPKSSQKRSHFKGNKSAIQEAIIFLQEKGKRPTQQAIATYTGLSRKTVGKHLLEEI